MKVIIVVPSLPVKLNEIKGGMHAAVVYLLDGFKNKSITVRVISFTREIKNRQFIQYASNIEIVYEYEGSLTFHSLNYLYYGSTILKKNIIEFNPDILHYQAGNTLLFTKLFLKSNLKHVLTMHANAFEELKTKTSFKDKFTWWFNGVIHNLISSPFIIYLSEISKNAYLNKSVIKHALIPNAITADYFNMPLNQITHNKLVYIGVLNNRKNIYYLLSVLKKLVNKNIYYHLDILGDFVDEEYREKVTQFIKDENLSEFIHFRGWVNKSELLNYLKESDIMVMTSMQETLPMVIAESMAAGKVVISSNVGGISKMIHHQNDGYLFDLSNPAELENILVNLYNNQEQINSIIANARNSSKKYLSDTVAADTMKFYEVCLNGR